jgi:hypothetical protein
VCVYRHTHTHTGTGTHTHVYILGIRRLKEAEPAAESVLDAFGSKGVDACVAMVARRAGASSGRTSVMHQQAELGASWLLHSLES